MTDWRQRLHGDPANWLLDAADNPSVCFWFLRDVVGRPENAPNVVETRDLALYSDEVQNIFAAQDPAGFWESSFSLDLPRYRATLWTIALLAELGLPRQSRRARAACEFILQSRFTENGDFVGLRDMGLRGLLVHALVYFIGPQDTRVLRAAERLAQTADISPDSIVFTLWGLSSIPPDHRTLDVDKRVSQATEHVLDRLANRGYPTSGTFPSFDPSDLFLALYVISHVGRLADPRAQSALERVWEAQREDGRWALATSYGGMLLIEAEPTGVPSKWATLNALRIVTRS